METKYGKNTKYRMLHFWVENRLGKPSKCHHCGTTEKEKVYDWANVSGEYRKDIKDWLRLCRKCHLRMDWTHCRKGKHLLDGDNIYYHPKGHRQCRACKSDYMRSWYRANPKEVKK